MVFGLAILSFDVVTAVYKVYGDGARTAASVREFKHAASNIIFRSVSGRPTLP